MESLAADLATMVRTPLHAEHVERMREFGTTRTYGAGDMVCRFGDPSDTFFYVEDGEVEAVDPVSGARYARATLGPSQFFGEISFLHGGRTMLGARAVRPSRLLCCGS